MYKIEVNGKVTKEALFEKEPTEVERILRDGINKSMMESIDKKLDELSFINLEPDIDSGDFSWTADVVLCSNTQVQTSIQMVVTNLVEMGFDGEQIKKTLAPLQENMEGW